MECPEGFFAEDSSHSCVKVCYHDDQAFPFFGYTVTKVCTQICPDFWYADITTGLCVQKCPDTWFANQLESICV